MRLVFVHGWAFNARFWDRVRELLSDIPSVCVELGFLDNPRSVPPFSPDDILVGHSLGFVWGIKEYTSWQGWIAINSFARFVDKENGGCVSSATLRALQQHLSWDPEMAVGAFHQNLGSEGSAVSINTEALQEGLTFLRNTDISKILPTGKGLILASEDDGLVPVNASVYLAERREKTEIFWQRNGGHLLPLTNPEWCAEKIRGFIT